LIIARALNFTSETKSRKSVINVDAVSPKSTTHQLAVPSTRSVALTLRSHVAVVAVPAKALKEILKHNQTKASAVVDSLRPLFHVAESVLVSAHPYPDKIGTNK